MADTDKSRKSLAAITLAPGAVASAADVPKERAQFRALTVANPNYFGNVVGSPLPPIVGIGGKNDRQH